MADFDIILKCWPAVESDFNSYGGDVLVTLFNDYPETQQLFPKFCNIPRSGLAGNSDIAEHGGVVLKKLGELIKAKGNHGAILKPLATTHANKHKIGLNNFKLITEALIKVLVKRASIDIATQDAIRKVMGVVINDIDGHYKELGFAG